MKTQNKNVFNETQKFHPLIFVILFVVNLALVLYLYDRLIVLDKEAIGSIVPSILVTLLFLLAKLTTRITDEGIAFKYFPFFINKKINLSDVSALEVRKNSNVKQLITGYGIRLTEDGWLYNTRGNDFLEIKLNNGKTIKLGTQKAGELEKVIDNLTLDK